MKKLLVSLFSLLCNFVYAQQSPDFPDMRSWGFYGDTTDRYVFADTAFVRQAPDRKATIMDTLFAGDNITVKGITGSGLTIRGIRGPWVKLSYAKNGETKTGYMWQGLVSFAPLRRGDVKFIYGIEGRADSIYRSGNYNDTIRRYLVTLKIVQGGRIILRSSLPTPDDESANYSGARVMSGMGLTNVQNIVVLTFSGEACAIPTYDYYLAWTKTNQLIRLPDKMNVADAGSYYHSETFTFPNEKNGKPDKIVWNMSDEEETEEVDKNGNNILKVTGKKNVVYTWDGENGRVTNAPLP